MLEAATRPPIRLHGSDSDQDPTPQPQGCWWCECGPPLTDRPATLWVTQCLALVQSLLGEQPLGAWQRWGGPLPLGTLA